MIDETVEYEFYRAFIAGPLNPSYNPSYNPYKTIKIFWLLEPNRIDEANLTCKNEFCQTFRADPMNPAENF